MAGQEGTNPQDRTISSRQQPAYSSQPQDTQTTRGGRSREGRKRRAQEEGAEGAPGVDQCLVAKLLLNQLSLTSIGLRPANVMIVRFNRIYLHDSVRNQPAAQAADADHSR